MVYMGQPVKRSESQITRKNLHTYNTIKYQYHGLWEIYKRQESWVVLLGSFSIQENNYFFAWATRNTQRRNIYIYNISMPLTLIYTSNVSWIRNSYIHSTFSITNPCITGRPTNYGVSIIHSLLGLSTWY